MEIKAADAVAGDTVRNQLRRPGLFFWLIAVVFVTLFCIAITSSSWGRAAEWDNKNGPKIYEGSADGSEQIADALANVKKSARCVLLEFGGNWCIPCIKLHRLFETNKIISGMLESNYVVVRIEYNTRNDDLVTKYHARELGLPFIVILNPDGERMTTKNTEELVDGDHYNPEKILAFLKQWTPKALKVRSIAEWVCEFVQAPKGSDTTAGFEYIRSHSNEAIPALVDVIRSDGPVTDEQRIVAYQALGDLGTSAGSVVPFLIEQFTTNNQLVGFTAAALAELGPEAKRAIPKLRTILQATELTRVLEEPAQRSDPRSWLLFNAANCLAKIDPDSPQLASSLVIWLKSPNVFCRRVAPLILGKLGPAARIAVPALKGASADTDETVRQRATNAIAKIEEDNRLAPKDSR